MLTPTDRNKYGYLLYDQDAVDRARKINFLQQVGFKMREIKEVIDAPDDVLRQALANKVRELETKKDTMSSLINEAYRLMDSLGKTS